jgi:hypothetical protein
MTREQIVRTPPESILNPTWRSILSVAAVKLYVAVWFSSKFTNRTTVRWSHDEALMRSRLNADELITSESELEHHGLLWKPTPDRYCLVDSNTVAVEIDDNTAWSLAIRQLGVSK